ncbi:MAG: ComEC/Rec2 family competence protein [Leptospiraceae bacterium]|nr:ComEC/Rec2 family competence protein [Leptospiraceae bacterium]
MLAYYTFYTFVAFYVSLRLRNIFVFLFFLSLFLLVEFYFHIPFLRLEKKRYAAIVSIGLFLGLSLAIFRFSHIQDIKVHETVIKARGVVEQVGRRSLLVGLKDGVRLRLIQVRTEEIHKGDEIEFSCKTLDGSYGLLDKLQTISSLCRAQGELKIFPKQSTFQNLMRNLREIFEERLKQNLGGESLAKGFALSETHDMDYYELELYRQMGIAHLFAASGLHLGLLFGLVYLPLRYLRQEKLGYIVGAFFCFLFMLLLEIPVSLLRAFVFLLFYVIKKLSDERFEKKTTLFCAALISELLIPYSTFTVAFVLSFGVTAAILLFFEPVEDLLKSFLRNSYVRAHLSLTLSTFAAANVLSLLLFEKMNGMSLLYNFFAVPPAAFYLASLILGLFYDGFFFVTKLLDNFYRFLAQIHFWLYQSQFYPIKLSLQYIWSVAFILYLLYLFLLNYNKKIIAARKSFPYFIVIMSFAYGGFLWYSQNPVFQHKALPQLIIQYFDKELYVVGKLAHFLEGQKERELELLRLPLKKLKVPAELHHDLPFYLKPISEIHPTIEPKNGLLKSKKGCYVFFSSMKPELWQAQILADCAYLFVVMNKKDIQENYKLHRLWPLFGYQGEAKTLPFFKWQDFP